MMGRSRGRVRMPGWPWVHAPPIKSADCDSQGQLGCLLHACLPALTHDCVPAQQLQQLTAYPALQPLSAARPRCARRRLRPSVGCAPARPLRALLKPDACRPSARLPRYELKYSLQASMVLFGFGDYGYVSRPVPSAQALAAVPRSDRHRRRD